MRLRIVKAQKLWAAASMLAFTASSASAQEVTSSDLFAPHVSTLAANPGQKVGLHVHRTVAAQSAGQVNPADRTVYWMSAGVPHRFATR